MIVVADTSPLSYFIQVGCEFLLPDLYSQVIVPAAVFAELENPGAPPLVCQWLVNLPEWIDVRKPFLTPDAGLAALDPGEREAIQLAEEPHAEGRRPGGVLVKL